MFSTRWGSRTSSSMSMARLAVSFFEHAIERALYFVFILVSQSVVKASKVVLSTPFSNTAIFAVVALLAPFGVLSSVLLLNNTPAEAAINQQLHFQARLLTSGGSLIPDGNYNIQFHIYSDGDGLPGTADETLEWSGSYLRGNTQGIDVVNGYVSAQLGESASSQVNTLNNVDWNNGTLWLSINIGDTTSSSTTCNTESDFNSNCGGDGEMGPFIRLGSTPYAFNSDLLDGRDSGDFVQLDPGGTAQAVNTANAVIDIDQSGAGDIINLADGGTTVFTLADDGYATFQNSTDLATAFQILDQDGGVPIFNVDTDNERVGIGVADPDARLEVVGQDGVTESVLKIDVAGNDNRTNGLLFINATAALQPSALINTQNSGNGDQLRFHNDTVRVTTVSNDGEFTIKPSQDSTQALLIENNAASGNDAIFTADTTNENVELGDADLNVPLIFNDGATNILSLTAGTLTTDRTITLPDADGALLVDPLTTEGDLLYRDGSGTTRLAIGAANTCFRSNGTSASWASCSGTGDLLQNGNAFGATLVLGTNDANSVSIETNDNVQVTIADGGAVTFQNSTDSTTGLQILDQDGGVPIVNVDTLNERFGIGTATPDFLFEVVAPAGTTDPVASFTGENATDALGVAVGNTAGDLTIFVAGNNGDFVTGSTQGDVGLRITPGDDFFISNGTDVAFTLNGNGATTLQNGTDSTAGFQVLDADGGQEILVVDTTNEAVIIGDGDVNAAGLRVGQNFGVVTSGNYGGATISTYSTVDAQFPLLDLNKSGSNTFGTQSIVADNEGLGAVVFRGSDGTAFQNAASVAGYVDGTPGGGGDMPGRLEFATSADGSATPTVRLTIDSTGQALFANNVSVTGTVTVGTLGATDNADFLCRNTSNILAACNFTPLNSSLTDNVADALDIQEGTNNYININTTDSSENISFGNATTNPSFNFLGSGLVDVAGSVTVGGTLTVNSEGFTDLTGDGLAFNAGALEVDDSTATGFFRNGGNSFGATAVLGTNDAQSLQLEVGGVDAVTILDGGAVTFANETDSTSGFVIEDADGGTPIFNVDTTNERVGIGTATPSQVLQIVGNANDASLGSVLRVGASATSTTNNQYGIYSITDIEPTGASTATISGAINAIARANNTDALGQVITGASLNGRNNTTGTLSQARGVTAEAENTTTGDITTAIGGQFAVRNSGTGTIVDGIGVRVSNAANNGTITEQFGILVQDLTSGVSDYGVVIQGADTYALWLGSGADNTDAANGITFGQSADTNLYRSAADTLRTDDTLSVGGSFTFNGETFSDLTGTGLVNNAGSLEVDTTSASGFFQQGGNSFGATAVLGTNDAQSLQLEVGGVDAVTIADGGAVTFENETDSTSGFVINDADGGTPIFNVDTTNERVGIGTSTPGYRLDIQGAGTQQLNIQSTDVGGTAGIRLSENSGDVELRYNGTTNNLEIVGSNGDPGAFYFDRDRGYVAFGSTDNGGLSGSAFSDGDPVLATFSEDEENQLYIAAGGTDVDAFVTVSDGGASSFSFGLDDDDGDRFKLSRGTVLGTDDLLSITTSGATTFQNTADSTNAFSVLTQGSGTVFRIDTTNAQAEFANGSASTPSISFANDEDTGIYANGSDSIRFTNGGTDSVAINSLGNLGIGDTTPDALIELNGSRTLNAWGTAGAQFQVATGTFTDDSTAGSGTATIATFNSFAAPTLAATNASVTTTDAATLYVGGAPIAGTNQTITNSYSLIVDSGDVRLDGNTILGGTLELGTLGATDNANFVCRNSSNILAGCNFTPLSSTLTDNTTDALDIQEGTNNYININTTDASENISFGNATTNPSFNFLGTGVLTVAGNASLNGATTTIGDATTDRLTINAQIPGFQPLVFQGATDNAFTTTLQFADPTANRIANFPDASGTVILSSTLPDTAFVQDGNSFGATAVLGTNDAQSLVFEVGGNSAVTIADGGAVTLQNETDSTAGFVVNNAAGTAILTVDTVNSDVIFSNDVIFDESIEIAEGNISSPFGGFGQGGNLTLDSEGLDNTFRWTGTNTTITANNVVSPNGVTTAETIVATANGATVVSDDTTALGDNTYTFAIWVKTDSGTEDFQLRIDSDGTPATGTAATFSATTEWRRYSVTQAFTGSPTTISPTIVIDNNTGELHAWGASTHIGSEPQVYNKTNSSDGGVSDIYGAFVNNRLSLDSDGAIYFGYGDGNNSTSLNENRLRVPSGDFSLQVEQTFIVDADDGENTLVVDPRTVANGDAGTGINFAAEDAVTQTGVITGFSLDLDTNFTVPDSANGNQTGIDLDIQDGGASATAIGIDLGGTGDTAINVSGTFTNILNEANVTLTGAGALSLDSTLAFGTLGTADSDTYLCRNTSNQLATCQNAPVTSSTAFIQNGNSFGATAVLGTNDAQSLQLEVGGVDAITIADGGAVTFENETDSTSGFVINDADGGTPILSVDTTNERVGIGQAAPSAGLDIVQSSTATSGTVRSVENTLTVNAGSASTGTFDAEFTDLDIAGSSNYTGVISGSRTLVENTSSAASTRIQGNYTDVRNSGTGSVTDQLAVGAYVENDSAGGTTRSKVFEGGFGVNSGTTAQAIGLDLDIDAYSTGNLTSGYGVRVDSTNFSTGTIGEFRGILVDDFQNIGGGALTSAAGLVLDEQADATNDSNLVIGQFAIPAGSFSIYNASTDNNVFAGNLRVGDTTAATGALQVVGDEVRIGDAGTADVAADDGDLYVEDALEVDGGFTFNSETFTDLTGTGLTNSGGVLTVDATSATGFFQQGGNSFGATAILGTNDAQSLQFEVGGTDAITIENGGDVLIGSGASNTDCQTLSGYNAGCNTQVGIYDTTTATSNTLLGLDTTIVANPGADSAAFYNGGSNVVRLQSSNNFTGGAIATSAIIENDSTGTLAEAVGLDASIYNNSTGTITAARGTENYITNDTGAITDARAVYNYLQLGAPSTNAYGVYNEIDLYDDNQTNVFGSRTAIQNSGSGTTSRVVGVQIDSTINFGGGGITDVAGIVIGNQVVGSGNNVNLLIGSTSNPTGDFSIYNSSSNPNYFSGNLGLGDTSPDARLDVTGTVATTASAQLVEIDATLTDPTNAQDGVDIDVNFSPSAASSQDPSALEVQLYSADADVGSSSILTAVDAQVYYEGGGDPQDQIAVAASNVLDGSANTNLLTGVYIQNRNFGSGTADDAYGINIENAINSGGGAITDNFGIRVDAQTAGVDNIGIIVGETTGTNSSNLVLGQTTIPTGNFSLYSASTDLSYFAGQVAIGTTSPAAWAEFEVSGDAQISTDLVVGNSLQVNGTADSWVLGEFGVGTNTPGSQLEIGGTYTSTSNLLEVSGTLDSTGNAVGVNINSTLDAGDGSVATGLEVDPSVTLDNAETLTTYRGIDIGAPAFSGTGTVTDVYGLYIRDQGTSGTGTNYGLRVFDLSRFDDQVTIGGAAGSSYLEVDTDPGDNLIALTVDQDDTTNNNVALQIENAGTGADLSIINTSSSAVLQLEANGSWTASITQDVSSNLRFNTDNNERLTLAAGGNVGLGSTSPSQSLEFGEDTDKTLGVETRTSAGVGRNLTVEAGDGNGTNAGGVLALQGGDSGASGNVNGGNVTLTGGQGNGTGTQGLVVVENLTFDTATTQIFGASGPITQANLDATGAVIVDATATELEVTVPDPTITTAGRLIYVSAADNSEDFTLTLNDGTANEINISLRENETATLIWNGSDWTAAGASSSNTLQSAYNNTLTSAGGAEIVLNAPGGDADGFTIRNNPTTAISGGILEVQSAIGTNLFSVNNIATEYAANGGAEDDSTFTSDWTAVSGTTINRETTTIATGTGSVEVIATGAGDGVRNNLATDLATSTQYMISFTARTSSGTWTSANVEVLYSRDGGTDEEVCANASTEDFVATGWRKFTCTITTDATSPTNADLIIRQADATSRTFYIDNLSINENSSSSAPDNVQIGGGQNGGPVTLFTLDRASAPPVADGDQTYLGSMYYDTVTGRIQCYESDGWGACGSAPNNYVNLLPEYAGSVLNGTGVGTMTADFCSNQSGVLQVNHSGTGAPCSTSGEVYNYYQWTSPQATQQTYSIYVTYQLPAEFGGFESNSTVQLTARTDSTTNGEVSYELFRNEGGTISTCGTETFVAGTNAPTTTADVWHTVGINGDEATGCGFSDSSADNFIIFKINMKANSNANVYASTLQFTSIGQ